MGASKGMVEKGGQDHTYEIDCISARGSHDVGNGVWCLETRQACGELWEEFVWCRRVNDKNYH